MAMSDEDLVPFMQQQQREAERREAERGAAERRARQRRGQGLAAEEEQEMAGRRAARAAAGRVNLETRVGAAMLQVLFRMSARQLCAWSLRYAASVGAPLASRSARGQRFSPTFILCNAFQGSIDEVELLPGMAGYVGSTGIYIFRWVTAVLCRACVSRTSVSAPCQNPMHQPASFVLRRNPFQLHPCACAMGSPCRNAVRKGTLPEQPCAPVRTCAPVLLVPDCLHLQ